MSSVSSRPYTAGSKSFDPQQLLQDEEKLKTANDFLGMGDLQSAIIIYFSLPENDSYVYHAVASVTLAQAQQAILQGDKHGLHDWYQDGDGRPVSHGFMHFVVCVIFNIELPTFPIHCYYDLISVLMLSLSAARPSS